MPSRAPNTHSLPTATQLASDIQRASGTQLAHCHTACPLSHSLPHCHTACPLLQSLSTATQLASYHRACQLPQSLPTATQLANGVQIANCHSLLTLWYPRIRKDSDGLSLSSWRWAVAEESLLPREARPQGFNGTHRSQRQGRRRQLDPLSHPILRPRARARAKRRKR